MAYTKTTWVASTSPGISATALNNLETQYDKAVEYSTTYMAPTSNPTFTGTVYLPGGYICPPKFTATSTIILKTLSTISAVYTESLNVWAEIGFSFTMPSGFVSGSAVRLNFGYFAQDSGSIKFKKNGVDVGSTWTDYTGTTQYASTDFTVNPGDVIVGYGKQTAGPGSRMYLTPGSYGFTVGGSMGFATSSGVGQLLSTAISWS